MKYLHNLQNNFEFRKIYCVLVVLIIFVKNCQCQILDLIRGDSSENSSEEEGSADYVLSLDDIEEDSKLSVVNIYIQPINSKGIGHTRTLTLSVSNFVLYHIRINWSVNTDTIQKCIMYRPLTVISWPFIGYSAKGNWSGESLSYCNMA